MFLEILWEDSESGEATVYRILVVRLKFLKSCSSMHLFQLYTYVMNALFCFTPYDLVRFLCHVS